MSAPVKKGLTQPAPGEAKATVAVVKNKTLAPTSGSAKVQKSP